MHQGELEHAANTASCFYPPTMQWVRLVLEFLPSPLAPAPTSITLPSVAGTVTSDDTVMTNQLTDLRAGWTAEQNTLELGGTAGSDNEGPVDAGARNRRRDIADLWWLTGESALSVGRMQSITPAREVTKVPPTFCS